MHNPGWNKWNGGWSHFGGVEFCSLWKLQIPQGQTEAFPGSACGASRGQLDGQLKRLSANSRIPCSILANCGKLVLDLQVGHAETPQNTSRAAVKSSAASVYLRRCWGRTAKWRGKTASQLRQLRFSLWAGLLKVVASQTAVVQIPAVGGCVSSEAHEKTRKNQAWCTSEWES